LNYEDEREEQIRFTLICFSSDVLTRNCFRNFAM